MHPNIVALLARIDKALADNAGRSLLDANEANDVLLDLRLLASS